METARERVIFQAGQVQDLVERLAREVAARHASLEGLVLVGIRTGGAYLAGRLRQALADLTGVGLPAGVMDITLYRDDWTRLDAKPRVGRTQIDFPIDRSLVLLVDDVLFTGRTVRAALDALVDMGRPRRIELLVLIDRGQRELPIQPDYVGATVQPGAGEVVDVVLREGGAPQDQVVVRYR